MSSLEQLDASRGEGRHARPARRRRAGAPWLARLLWLEPFWLALLAPSVLLPGRFWLASWQPGLVLLLFAFWPLRLVVTRRLYGPTPLGWSLALLLASVAAGLLRHAARPVTWEAAGYLLFGLAAFVALVDWPPLRRNPAATGWPLAAAGAGLALAGPGLLGGVADKLGLGAAQLQAGPLAQTLGESINPNVLAGGLVLLFPLPLALALAPRWGTWPWRIGWGLVALALLAELALTQSRGAYLAAAAALLLVVVLRWPRSGYLLAPLTLLLLALLLSGMGLALLFDAVGDAAEGAPSGSLESMLERAEIWVLARRTLAAAPLTGVGLGMFAHVVAAQPHSAVLAVEAPSHAHNLLLQVGVELGVAGLVAYAALLLGVGAMLVALLRRRHSHTHRLHTRDVHRRRLRWALAAGSLASLVALCVHGLVDAALWGNKLAFLPWLLFALDANLFLACVRQRTVRTHANVESESS